MATTRPSIITQKQVTTALKPRPQDSHKGMFGTVTVLGGNTGMVGAAVLAGRAALKLGAGCVNVGLLAEHAPTMDCLMPELMLHPAPSALSHSEPTVLVIGCGMGRDLTAQKLLYDALMRDIPTVLDADALNILAQRPDLRSMLHARKSALILTPHPGEAARLLATTTDDIQADRPAAALAVAKKFSASVVLKGADSLCVTRDGKLHLNKTGNAGMSSAGMGDVLAGIIAALIAQGVDADHALLSGVHLHGAAGDALAQQHATLGMSATEVTEWARFLLNQWQPR